MTRWLQESVEGFHRGGTTEAWRHEVHSLLPADSTLFFCVCGPYSFRWVLLFNQNLPRIDSRHDEWIFVYRKEKRLRKSMDKTFREDLAKRAAYLVRRSMLRRYFRFFQVFLRIPDGLHNLHQESPDINFIGMLLCLMSNVNPSSRSWWEDGGSARREWMQGYRHEHFWGRYWFFFLRKVPFVHLLHLETLLENERMTESTSSKSQYWYFIEFWLKYPILASTLSWNFAQVYIAQNKISFALWQAWRLFVIWTGPRFVRSFT